MSKRILSILTLLVLLSSNVVYGYHYEDTDGVVKEYNLEIEGLGVKDWQTKDKQALESLIVANKDKTKLIKEIDNLLTQRVNLENSIQTVRGVSIYQPDQIEALHVIDNAIAMRYELLTGAEKFKYITFPLYMIHDMYGLMSGYDETDDSSRFFKEQTELDAKNETAINIIDYKKYHTPEQYKRIVDTINNLNVPDSFLNKTNIVIQYNQYSAFGLYERSIEELEDKYKTSYIVVIPDENNDMASTIVHELGHQFHYETLKNSRFNKYEQFYEIPYYKDIYSTPWTKKITENIAEDFKVTVLGNSPKVLEVIGKKGLEKETDYEYANGIKEFILNNLENHDMQAIKYFPDINVSLSDYNNIWKIKSGVSINSEVPNKIPTTSKNIQISINKEDSIYEYKSAEVKLYNGEKLISTKKYTGNTIKISNSNSAEINLTFKHNDMEIIKTIYVDNVK